jgi:uncharacterized membrane protein
MNRAELKAKAKAQIKGNIGILFVVTLIIGLISSVASAIPAAGAVAAIIVLPAFSLSIYRIYLMIVNGKKPEVKDAFCGFDDFWSAFKVTFLVGLYTFLWSLLFFIPGIVKAYSYSMALYVLAENPGKSARECIKESMEMTKGHKMELFVLDLSFIGWIILVPFTLGLLSIWLIPYMSATITNAYESLKPVTVISAEEPQAGEAPEPTETVE